MINLLMKYKATNSLKYLQINKIVLHLIKIVIKISIKMRKGIGHIVSR